MSQPFTRGTGRRTATRAPHSWSCCWARRRARTVNPSTDAWANGAATTTSRWRQSAARPRRRGSTLTQRGRSGGPCSPSRGRTASWTTRRRSTSPSRACRSRHPTCSTTTSSSGYCRHLHSALHERPHIVEHAAAEARQRGAGAQRAIGDGRPEAGRGRRLREVLRTRKALGVARSNVADARVAGPRHGAACSSANSCRRNELLAAAGGARRREAERIAGRERGRSRPGDLQPQARRTHGSRRRTSPKRSQRPSMCLAISTT